MSIESLQAITFDCTPNWDERMNIAIEGLTIEWYKDEIKLEEGTPTLILEKPGRLQSKHYYLVLK